MLKTTKNNLIESWKELHISAKIIKAFKEIPREEFVPANYREFAYDDYPLPIGPEATISQPTTVIMMLNWLEPEENDKILEIGTGSGYNAALLSKLCRQVVTAEINHNLVIKAKKTISKLKLKNIKIIETDGSKGYKQESPYDKIISTASSERIPDEWISQLKDNGVIIAPIITEMKKITKTKKYGIKEEYLGEFAFVPMKH